MVRGEVERLEREHLDPLLSSAATIKVRLTCNDADALLVNLAFLITV
jgi:hypothetical protein